MIHRSKQLTPILSIDTLEVSDLKREENILSFFFFLSGEKFLVPLSNSLHDTSFASLFTGLRNAAPTYINGGAGA